MFIEVYSTLFHHRIKTLYFDTSVSHDQEQLSLFRKQLRESREPSRGENNIIISICLE